MDEMDRDKPEQPYFLFFFFFRCGVNVLVSSLRNNSL